MRILPKLHHQEKGPVICASTTTSGHVVYAFAVEMNEIMREGRWARAHVSSQDADRSSGYSSRTQQDLNRMANTTDTQPCRPALSAPGDPPCCDATLQYAVYGAPRLPIRCCHHIYS
jgi:hypothetical protein